MGSGAWRRALHAAALALVMSALAAPVEWRQARAASRPWHVDTSGSRLVIHVFRKGLLSPVLHDHHFVPASWSGTVTFDPQHLRQIDVRLTVAADSLRDRQPELSPEDIEKVERQARGPMVLDAGRYPVIRFTGDRLEPSEPPSVAETEGAVQGVLVGTLDLHGRTQGIRAPVRARWSVNSLDAEGEVSFKQTDFGIKPYSTFLGAIAVQDRVTVEFSVRATAP